MKIFGIDLAQTFALDVNPLELIIRGTLTYVLVLVLLRILGRGRTGTTIADLLVLVLIADAAQNAMSAQYKTFSSGLVLVTTIVFCSYALNWLAYHVPALQGIVHPGRKSLVINGRIMRLTLANELMTEDELMTELRMSGIEHVADVRAAYLEGNGEISVIRAGKESSGSRKKEPRGGGG